jgi:hypothetical protein
MCIYSATKSQRLLIFNSILPIARELDTVDTLAPYPFIESECKHVLGTCRIDKDKFIQTILDAIRRKDWRMVSTLQHVWDEMSWYDLRNEYS